MEPSVLAPLLLTTHPLSRQFAPHPTFLLPPPPFRPTTITGNKELGKQPEHRRPNLTTQTCYIGGFILVLHLPVL